MLVPRDHSHLLPPVPCHLQAPAGRPHTGLSQTNNGEAFKVPTTISWGLSIKGERGRVISVAQLRTTRL